MASLVGRLNRLFSRSASSSKKPKNLPLDENFTFAAGITYNPTRDQNDYHENENADHYSICNFKPNGIDEIELIQNDPVSMIKKSNDRSLVKNLRTKYTGYVPDDCLTSMADEIKNQP